jgi:hypothetical protein
MTYQGPDDQQPPQYQPYQQYPSAPPPGYGGYPQPAASNGMAIAGLVCGIIGLLIANVILGPLGIIFGGIGLSRANRGASGRGMAIAGIVLGVIDLVVGIVAIAYLSSRGFVL